jgi:hypothetical protein
MGDLIRRNLVIAALAGLAVLLAVGVVLEFIAARPGADRTPARRASAAETKLLPPIVAVAPEQAYPETSARPLFTPARRLVPEVIAVAQPTFQPGQFVLLGVTIAGDTRIALLREKASGRIHRIARGGEVNGIKVAAVEPETVTLAMGGQQEQLPLTVQKAGAPGAPGQPGAVANPAAAAAAMQGPFTPAGNATPQNVPGAPPVPQAPQPPFNQPGPHPQIPGVAPVQAPGAPFAPTAANQPQAAADPNAGLSPEEILARRRARRAQQSQ